MRQFCLTLALLLGIGSPFAVHAHGDLHERIEEKSRQISEDPDRLALYSERAALYLEHGDFSEAISDYQHAYQRGHMAEDLLLRMGQAFLGGEQSDSALIYTDRFLATDSLNERGRRLRGRILQSMERYEEAAAEFAIVVDYAWGDFTRNYLELADAWAKVGLAGVEKGISALRAGMAELGELSEFREKITELELKRKNFNGAVREVTALLEGTLRKEKWLVKRAGIYLEAGKRQLAEADLDAAVEAIAELPEQIQKGEVIAELVNKISALRDRLKQQENPKEPDTEQE